MNSNDLETIVDYMYDTVESFEDACEVLNVPLDDRASLEIDLYTVLDKCSNCQSWQPVSSLDKAGYCEFCN